MLERMFKVRHWSGPLPDPAECDDYRTTNRDERSTYAEACELAAAYATLHTGHTYAVFELRGVAHGPLPKPLPLPKNYTEVSR